MSADNHRLGRKRPNCCQHSADTLVHIHFAVAAAGAALAAAVVASAAAGGAGAGAAVSVVVVAAGTLRSDMPLRDSASKMEPDRAQSWSIRSQRCFPVERLVAAANAECT